MATNVHLTPELERFARECVEGGRYNNVSEVVRSGLRLLQDAEERRIRFNAMLKETESEADRDGTARAVEAGRTGAPAGPDRAAEARGSGARSDRVTGDQIHREEPERVPRLRARHLRHRRSALLHDLRPNVLIYTPGGVRFSVLWHRLPACVSLSNTGWKPVPQEHLATYFPPFSPCPFGS